MSTSTDRDRERGIQTVRNAWINAMRNEVLRTSGPELPRIIHVGMWIATYADADGSNAFPARETLARLAGCSKESVTRAVKVMLAVGVLQRKRRPNASTVFQLVIPTERPDWGAHLHLYTETRQREYRRRKAAEERAEQAPRKASGDAVRKASPSNVPEGVPGRSPDELEGVPGRPRKMSPDAFRKASPTVAYQYPPTSGRDPLPDHEMADHSPQPQVRVREAPQQDPSPTPPADREADPAALRRCTDCHQPLVRPGRTRCTGCERAHPGAA